MFLDLRKEYETLDYGRVLHTLEGYGEGTNMRGLLVKLCENQKVVTR